MKRSSPLKRKANINRGTSQLKRSSLKKQSSKKRKMNNEYRDEREAFKRELGCPCGRVATCHEIHGGSSRNETFKMRIAWLALCWPHHQIVQDWPKTKQYCLKQLVDKDHYDRQGLNRLAGWAEDAIEQAEVDSERESVLLWLKEVKRG